MGGFEGSCMLSVVGIIKALVLRLQQASVRIAYLSNVSHMLP